MAVLSEITVGDILYQLVDAPPTGSAPTGSIAILPQAAISSSIIYQNIDGSTKWVQLQTSAYGTNYFYTPGSAATNPTQNTWVNLDTRPWTGSGLMNFTTTGTTNAQLTYDTGNPTALFLLTWNMTLVGASARQYSVESIAALNNTVPAANTQIGTTTAANVPSSMQGVKIETLSGGEYVNFGHRWTANAGGGPQNGYSIDGVTYQVQKIRELISTTLFSDDFESGNFTAGGWTAVNGAETNQWVVGTATNNGGTYGAYISNNGGTSNSYTITADSQTHIYVDVNIPTGSVGTTIQFDWKCQGENAAGDDQYDWGRVYVAPTTVTPTAGVLPDIQYRVGSIKYNLQSTFTSETITLDSSYAGAPWRFIFTWNNDGSVGTDPPFAIDNVIISTLE